jgi:serine/threonine protein kinase
MYIFNGKYKNGPFLYRRILYDERVLPENFSPEVRSFISALLEKNPSQRLGTGKSGAENVKAHPFFSVSTIPISVII